MLRLRQSTLLGELLDLEGDFGCRLGDKVAHRTLDGVGGALQIGGHIGGGGSPQLSKGIRIIFKKNGDHLDQEVIGSIHAIARQVQIAAGRRVSGSIHRRLLDLSDCKQVADQLPGAGISVAAKEQDLLAEPRLRELAPYAEQAGSR